MDHANFMSGHQAVDDLPREGHRIRDGQRADAPDHCGQRLALDERHRQVLQAVEIADIVNADDVAVGDLAGELRFALEAALHVAARAGVGAFGKGNGLDGDVDAELVVPRLVDRAHAAKAEHADNGVAGADLVADAQSSAGSGFGTGDDSWRQRRFVRRVIGHGARPGVHVIMNRNPFRGTARAG